MVHMWVNTVTGCGLPREEINGLRFGPPVDQAGPSVYWCSEVLARVAARIAAHRFELLRRIRGRVCACLRVFVRVCARATQRPPFVSLSASLRWTRGRGCVLG